MALEQLADLSRARRLRGTVVDGAAARLARVEWAPARGDRRFSVGSNQSYRARRLGGVARGSLDGGGIFGSRPGAAGDDRAPVRLPRYRGGSRASPTHRSPSTAGALYSDGPCGGQVAHECTRHRASSAESRIDLAAAD